MKLHPTIVLGIGSTGKYIVANVQKYLYEVLNGETLDLFKCIVLETALNEQEQILLPASVRTRPVPIKVDNIGNAYFGMKRVLGDEFNWCPSDMHIDGAGAGNKRAGGRLMLFYHMSMVANILRTAIDGVKTAARDHHTIARINELLVKRGSAVEPQAVPHNEVPAVIVVGTLAGGTGSGVCVDLGYLIRRVEPGARPEALFIIPDNTAIHTFMANSWAALSDLAYFTSNPANYKAAWVSEAQAREVHDESRKTGPKPPYDRIYLLSDRDANGNAHLPYSPSPSSPLCMMAGLTIAANLLGLYQLRDERLADFNTRVGRNPIYNTFLTSGLRGVSYPKYEISEAATCKIIADQICENWLSKESCYVEGRREDLQQEEINKRGRDTWNQKCPSIWDGLRGTLNINEYARRIKSGQVTDVSKYLFAELTENRDGTMFRTIHQNVENRRRELQSMMRFALVEVLQQKQNLAYADWFLSGIQSEIDRTLKYWQGLQIPAGDNDLLSWQKKVRELISRMEQRFHSLSANLLLQRLDVIEDELEQLVTRLEMFLMTKTLAQVSKWANEELKTKLDNATQLLTDLKLSATERTQAIALGLEDKTGPLLKISRSRDRRFTEEIAALAKFEPNIPGRQFVDYTDKFTGLLPLEGQNRNSGRERLFLTLLERIQPSLIQQLQGGEPIDIATEIERQEVTNQAIQRAHATLRLSLPLTHPFMTGQDNVPSLLLTKREDISRRVQQLLHNNDRSFPALKADELPLIDHMAIFYQEGAKFELESLSYVDDYKSAYEEARQSDEATIDPLRHLKRPAAVKAAAQPQTDSRTE